MNLSRRVFDYPSLQKQLGALEALQAEPDFWSDQDEATKTLRKVQSLKQWVVPLSEAAATGEELQLMLEMMQEENDEESVVEVEQSVTSLERTVEKLDSQFLLSGEDDERGAVLEIHPGAGGTESQDWAQMLMRMYNRHFERNEWKSKTLDIQSGDEAGIKSVVLEIDAPFAYGYLKSESGVHRLVRISPFDSQNRRHTSFASVYVYPLVNDDVEVEIDSTDLRIDTYRASGAGGQHVNKTDSAIRITHEPSGVVVQCQNERSQLRNRESAMTMLRAKLYMLIMEERQKERDEIEAEKLENAWGSQIRSYVLQPYTKVKDHRTDFESGNAIGVLDGDLNPFTEAYLRMMGAKRKTS
ncbi:MAG: peptide chain release factor 2 [Candidatus Krumholzibacteriia bacterium]